MLSSENYLVLAENIIYLNSKRLAELVNDTLVIHKKEKHIFRACNAVGLNSEILTSDKLKYNYIEFHIAGEVYRTTRTHYLSKSFPLHFKQRGYELQKFLRLSDFNLELKVKPLVIPKAPEIEPELNLFSQVV